MTVVLVLLEVHKDSTDDDEHVPQHHAVPHPYRSKIEDLPFLDSGTWKRDGQ